VLSPSAAITRAVERAAAALRSRGCEVYRFKPPDVRSLLGAYLGALSADGGAEIRVALAGGEVDPSLEGLRRLALLPAHVRRAASSAARAVGQGSLALLLDAIGAKSVTELWRVTERLRRYRAEFLEEMDTAGIDALLCPAYATPALPHGASKGFTLASSYSMVFNATQFPAGVVPVTRVRGIETQRAPGRDRLQSHAADVDEKSLGLPVGVQVVGRPWRDSVVLAVMGAIEAEVSADEGFPRTPVDPT
jgi:fatty acid amide hydrolase